MEPTTPTPDGPAAPAPARNSAVDQIADRYVADSAALDPGLATVLGVAGHDHELPGLSPQWHDTVADLARATLRELAGAERGPIDDVDRITIAAMRERLGVYLERVDAGELLSDLNVVASPVQEVRSVFDLMPTRTVPDWENVAVRMAAVPAALEGYRRSLAAAAAEGRVAARRQVERAAAQCVDYGADDGFFRELAAGARVGDGALPAAVPAALPAALAADLARGAVAAAQAYQELAGFLREQLWPGAPVDDAVGIDRYGLNSRYFLGAAVDLPETYHWGLAELARIETEMTAVAGQIVPGGGVHEAVQALDADPARRIHGTEAFRDWMQELSDRTVADLAAAHFDIPEPVRRLDCRIAPTATGVIYYTAPSEDFSRPGAMWWSVPTGVEDFATWQEISTVYHEGVPGHHLQLGQTAFRSDRLNRWRRSMCWVSGHGEGWALYAERLMADLGYLDEPGARLGMLESQAFRAARVAVDIGVHLRLPAPAELGGGIWDAERAWAFLTRHTRLGEEVRRFELDRYLGWPGQAPSYKVGERIWLDLREQVRAREGSDFDLAAFHRRALDLGSVGLDVLREALAPI